jgi:hypothetical protein
MGNKISLKKLILKTCPCLSKKSYTKISEEDIKPYKKIQILQISENEFVPQGNYRNFENYPILNSLLNKPLMKIYINEIFRPNKSIKSFQYQKIKGIFNQIKPEINSLFKKFNIKLVIPNKPFKYKSFNYSLEGNPATTEDLDNYFPIFLMELLIYPKSFIKNSKIKKIIILHNIQLKKINLSQERSGFPEFTETKSLILSSKERNFAYIRIVLHHEIFHYIDWIDDYSFKDAQFAKLNIKNFSYGNGGENEREWIKLDKNLKGFINHYSTSALEEDKAEIYQYLIGCPDEALNNKDEIVMKKAQRIQEFVNQFDKKGIGKKEKNFWGNLMDFRSNFVYKESVFQGNIC